MSVMTIVEQMIVICFLILIGGILYRKKNFKGSYGKGYFCTDCEHYQSGTFTAFCVICAGAYSDWKGNGQYGFVYHMLYVCLSDRLDHIHNHADPERKKICLSDDDRIR